MMTNDEVSIEAEVDVSKQYSQGQALQVVRIPFNMMGIRFKKKGILPNELTGTYTNAARALQSIHSFITKRDAYFENIARRNEARKNLKRLKKTEDKED